MRLDKLEMELELTKDEFEKFVPISQEEEGKPGVWVYKPIIINSIAVEIFDRDFITYIRPLAK